MSKYIEFRKSLETNRSDRSLIIPLHELPQQVDPYVDCYRSLFFYDEDILRHVAEKKSVTGFRGKAGIDRLVWDFDHEDLEVSRKSILSLIERLQTQYNVGEDEIGIFFSGRKGFNLELKCTGIAGLDGVLDENIPIYVKRFCIKLAGDLESFDRVIYNHNRLYRIAGTLHQKESDLDGTAAARLFKTSLPFHLLRDAPIASIKKYAMEIRIPEKFNNISDTSKISEEVKYIIEHINELNREAVILPKAQVDGLPDARYAPKHFKTCIWRLCQGTYTEGRDNALLRIADHERKLGMPAEVIKSKLSGVVELMDINDPQKAKLDPITDVDLDRIVRQVFNNNYDWGCFDSLLSSQCDRRCYLAAKKFNDSTADTVTLLEAYKRSKSFYQKYYENIVPTGLASIDNNMPLFLSTFNLIVGKPGTGKTSIMLNIMKNASLSNISALFFSMDMSEEMLVQRCAPILLANRDGEPYISGKEFMQAHARGDNALMEKAQEVFEEISKNVVISSKRDMTVQTISDEIDRYEALWGKKVKLVIVDYVQLLTSDKEGWANATFNAHELTKLAKDKKVCLLGLSQAPRSSTDPSLVFAKGSGAWEEQASTQMNCFRPFCNTHPEYDYIMSIRMAKNRLGGTDTIDLFFNGPSGFVRDLTEHEKLELAALRDRLEHEDN